MIRLLTFSSTDIPILSEITAWVFSFSGLIWVLYLILTGVDPSSIGLGHGRRDTFGIWRIQFLRIMRLGQGIRRLGFSLQQMRKLVAFLREKHYWDRENHNKTGDLCQVLWRFTLTGRFPLTLVLLSWQGVTLSDTWLFRAWLGWAGMDSGMQPHIGVVLALCSSSEEPTGRLG